jgi:hypothetical protein
MSPLVDNKTNVRNTAFKFADWAELAQDKAQWWACLGTLTYIQAP